MYTTLLIHHLAANTITVNFVASTAAVGGSTTYYNVNQASPVLANSVATNSGSSPINLSELLLAHTANYYTGI